VETLYSQRSRYQQIDLTNEGGRVTLFLDGFFQFDTRTERWYHELIAGLPMTMVPEAKRALVMGGGDGLAMREILSYPGVEAAVLAELDPDVVTLCSKPPVSTLNCGSLTDRRVRHVEGDAKVFVYSQPTPWPFDVIIADFPAATSAQLQTLYSPDFYRAVFERLSPDGVFVAQISEDADFLASARRFCRTTLGHAVSLVERPRALEMQAFLYASRRPLRVRREAHGTMLPGAVREIDALLEAGANVITLKMVKR
jgi:spermidine synthase